MHHELPPRLDLDWYRKAAKDLVRAYATGEEEAVARVDEVLGDRARARFRLSDAQWVIAQEHGYRSWAEFAKWVETVEPGTPVGRIGLEPVSVYEERAIALVDAVSAGDDGARRRVLAHVPRPDPLVHGALAERDAKLVIAREYGFPTWRQLIVHVEKAIREHEAQRDGSAPVLAALHAIRTGDVNLLAALLDERPDLIDDVHTGAWSTLLEAIAEPDVVGDHLGTELGVDRRVVELLIDRGAQLETALNLAACFNRSELVALLLDAGADPTHAATWGITALQSAVYHGSAEAADLLAEVALVPDTLYIAAATGRLDRLDAWFEPDGELRSDAFANRPNLADVGWPPAPPPRNDRQEVLDEAFALAACNGRLGAMERLLARGASVNGCAHLGMTALHFAVMGQRIDVVQWLLARGADQSIREGVHNGTAHGWADHAVADGDRVSVAIRDLLEVHVTPTPLALAFEAARTTWGERGTAQLDTGFTYGGVEPVLVHVTKRERRYKFSDDGAAVRLAGRGQRWRDVAAAIEAEYDVNVSRQGVVFLPAVEQSGMRWLASLPDRIAEASVALYGALLDLESG